MCSKWTPLDFIMLILTISISMLLLGLAYDMVRDHDKVVPADRGDQALAFVLALVAVLNGYVISNVKGMIK